MKPDIRRFLWRKTVLLLLSGPRREKETESEVCRRPALTAAAPRRRRAHRRRWPRSWPTSRSGLVQACQQLCPILTFEMFNTAVCILDWLSFIAGFSVESCERSAAQTEPGAPDEAEEKRQVKKGEKEQREGNSQTAAKVFAKEICRTQKAQQQKLCCVSEPSSTASFNTGCLFLG